MRSATMTVILCAGIVLTLSGCAPSEAPEQQASVTAVPQSFQFRCGVEVVVLAVLENETVELQIADRRYALRREVSASGEKYVNPDDPNTWIWTKGTHAQVMLAGRKLDECTAMGGESESTVEQRQNPVIQISWLLEDIDHTGIIDSSHLTLTFDDTGSLHGSGGCNNFQGSYLLLNEALSIDPRLATTRRACAAEATMFQEQRYLSLLPLMTSATIDSTGALVLASVQGQTLTFRQEAESQPSARLQ